MMIGMIIFIMLSLGMWFFILIIFLQGGNEVTSKETMKIILVFMTFVLAISFVTFFCTAHRWFSVIEITEKGIKKSLFKIFQKTEIAWSEISEIRFCSRVGYWLLISKTKLDGVYYDDIVKRKDVIQIEFNKKIYHILRQYWKEEIINLPKNIEQSIRSK